MLLRCQVRRKQENALAALRALEVPILHPLASLFRCLPSFLPAVLEMLCQEV